MDSSFIILFTLVASASIIAFWRGGWPLISAGLKSGVRNMKSMWWRVLSGILLAGFLQVLIPRTVIAEWIGPASGFTGVLVGSFAGMILTGGPFVIIPIIASIYASGAAEAPIIALLAAAQLTRVQGLFILDIPFFGTRIALLRYGLCLFIPPLVGLAGGTLFRLM